MVCSCQECGCRVLAKFNKIIFISSFELWTRSYAFLNQKHRSTRANEFVKITQD